MHQHKIISDVVQRQDVCVLPPDATVFEGARQMAGKNIAALIIVDDVESKKMIGIVTERDMTQKVLAKGVDPKQATLGEIMTKNPDTVAPDDSAADALELMQTRKYRHLPVAEQGRCVAVVSVRDLFSVVKADLEKEVRETEAFVFGDRYGA